MLDLTKNWRMDIASAFQMIDPDEEIELVSWEL